MCLKEWLFFRSWRKYLKCKKDHIVTEELCKRKKDHTAKGRKGHQFKVNGNISSLLPLCLSCFLPLVWNRVKLQIKAHDANISTGNICAKCKQTSEELRKLRLTVALILYVHITVKCMNMRRVRAMAYCFYWLLCQAAAAAAAEKIKHAQPIHMKATKKK